MQHLEHRPQTGTDPIESTDRQDRIEPPETTQLPETVSSAEAKLVYLYLSVRGTATVDELGQSLRLPKLSLFSILTTLRKNDVVARDGDVVRIN